MTVDAAADSGQIRYWGFISYSHEDRKHAEWLHRSLESYRLPGRLVGRETEIGPVPRRLVPVFRDRDELAGSSDLGSELREALESSRSLIVMCSPHAAASEWVGEEIRTFSELGRADRIFCVIVSGDPEATDAASRCFPPALSGVPLACDLREPGGGRLDTRLRLVAGILGLSYDELKQRHRQRRIRRMIAGSMAAAVLLAGFGLLSSYALGQRAIADARTLASASVAATEQDLDPVAGLELAIRAAERSPTGEAASALALAIEHQRSLVILQHDAEVVRASFSSDASRILTCGEEPTAHVWDAVSGRVLLELTGSADRIWLCAFSPDGSTVITVGASEARLWNAESGQLIASPEGHSDQITSARFSADGAQIVTSARDGTARIWSAVNGRPLATIDASPEPLRTAFVLSGSGRILTVADNGECAIWDVASGRQLHTFGELMPGVHDAVLSPAGNRLLVANYQYRPWLWDLTEVRLINGAMAIPHVAGAAFSGDGTMLALGGGDGVVTVWDADEAFLVKRLQHPEMVASLAFSPGGQVLVTAADRVRIWGTPVLGGGVDNEIGTLRGHSGPSRIEMFAPDDDTRILTIGRDDHTVRVWDIASWVDNSNLATPTLASVPELLELARQRRPVRGSTVPQD